MKNLLQKVFLLFAVFLFSWGYGQICIQENTQRIVSNTTYPGVTAIASSITPSGAPNNSVTTANIIDDDLSTFSSYASSNPTYSLPANFTPGTGSGTITIQNLDIKNGERIHLNIGEYERIYGLSTSVTYTISTEKNNVKILNNLSIEPEFPLSQVLLTNRDGSLTFTTTEDIDKIIINYTLSKPAIIGPSTQSPINVRFYGLYVNPLCEQQVITTCNQEVNLINSNFNNQLTASGTIVGSNNVLNDNLNEAATFTISGNLTINNTKVFSGGQYVAFELQESSLADLGYTYTIETLLNGQSIESKTFSNVGISLVASGKRSLGFSTSLPFNQVKISGTVVGLSTVSIYRAFIIENCAEDFDLICNTNTPITQNNFAAIINSERSGNSALLTAGNLYENPNHVVDNNPDNYATIFAAAGAIANSSIAVKSLSQTFPGGYYAGFLIENASLVNLDLLSNITIKTYKDGNLVEQASGNALGLNLQLFPGTNKRIVGFNTREGSQYDFDEVVFETNSTVAVSLGVTNIYHAVIRENCIGPDLTCNTDTRVALPDYPVSISPRTGISGVGVVGQINNADNVLNNDPDEYATINITVGALGSANFAVQTGNQIFDAGTFAGFEVASTSLLDVGLLNSITIKTYLNGVLQESSNSGNLLLDVGAIGATPKAIIGFETTLPFNEVEYSMGITVNVDLLGETRIYNLVLKKFCEPTTPLVCNEMRTLKELEFPVTAYTKVSSLANGSLIGDLVQNIGNLLDNDTDNYVTLNPTLSAGTTLTIGVNKAGLPFKPGTYAEFEVQSANLIDASLLNNFSVRLINKAGVTVETISSDALLLGVGLFQFGTQETQKIGFKSSFEFSKAELVYNIPLSVTLGTTRIYRFNVMETCPIELECNDSDPITTVDRPVIINAINTGTAGLACVGCSINNPENLIDGDLTNSTRLVVALGAAARNAISVKDLVNIYPAGSSVGFATAEGNPILHLDLLNTIRVTTYLNGQPVESASGSNLINLNALFIQIFPQNAVYGFRTTSKFDEVQISIGSLASAINTIDLSSLVISTQGANDPTLDFECPSDICVKPGNMQGAGTPTLTGISTLQNPRTTWPNDIPNGFIALDSKNKGMVITRVANTDAIASPLEGMLIYDLSANCVKLYNGTVWKCLEQSCNE